MTPVEILLMSEKLSNWVNELLRIESNLSPENVHEIVNGKIYNLRKQITELDDSLKQIKRDMVK